MLESGTVTRLPKERRVTYAYELFQVQVLVVKVQETYVLLIHRSEEVVLGVVKVVLELVVELSICYSRFKVVNSYELGVIGYR